MRPLGGDLAGLRVERRRRRVAVDALDVDRLARRRACARRAARRARRGTRAARRPPPSRSCATPTPSRPSRPMPSSPARPAPRSVPSSRAAVSRITSITPWPTSAAAQCTSAPSPPDAAVKSVTRAAVKSSKPSEKPMFLKPIANPSPRWTPSPRVVLPAPPGSRTDVARERLRLRRAQVACRPQHLGDGERAGHDLAGRQRARPGASAFSSRSSTGSMSSASASLSICASAAKQVWTAPKPRIAPHGGLLV